MIRTNTRKFREQYGKAPSGEADWRFILTVNYDDYPTNKVTYRGEYSECLAKAKDEAARVGANWVTVDM